MDEPKAVETSREALKEAEQRLLTQFGRSHMYISLQDWMEKAIQLEARLSPEAIPERNSYPHYPQPWEFLEEGCNGGPGVFDAKGSCFVALFWPIHPAEETAQAEQETYALGRAIASLANPTPSAIERAARRISLLFGERLHQSKSNTEFLQEMLREALGVKI